MALSAPHTLSEDDVLENFECTKPELARWLIERALKNHRDGASRTFVVSTEGREVVGYYALAAGSASLQDTPGKVRRNMPDPIPIAVLARLAVHSGHAGQGIGKGLLKDATARVIQTAQQMGIRALLCHAIDEDAKAFYVKYGFVESPTDPMTVMLPLQRLV